MPICEGPGAKGGRAQGGRSKPPGRGAPWGRRGSRKAQLEDETTDDLNLSNHSSIQTTTRRAPRQAMRRDKRTGMCVLRDASLRRVLAPCPCVDLRLGRLGSPRGRSAKRLSRHAKDPSQQVIPSAAKRGRDTSEATDEINLFEDQQKRPSGRYISQSAFALDPVRFVDSLFPPVVGRSE